MNVFSGKE
jgi:hypothetical protein